MDAPKAPTLPASPTTKPVVKSSIVAQEPVKVVPVLVAKPAAASTSTTAAPVKLVPRRSERMDLFGGKRVERRERSFGDDAEDCPY